jgi:hypothetical protein
VALPQWGTRGHRLEIFSKSLEVSLPTRDPSPRRLACRRYSPYTNVCSTAWRLCSPAARRSRRSARRFSTSRRWRASSRNAVRPPCARRERPLHGRDHARDARPEQGRGEWLTEWLKIIRGRLPPLVVRQAALRASRRLSRQILGAVIRGRDGARHRRHASGLAWVVENFRPAFQAIGWPIDATLTGFDRRCLPCRRHS